MSIMPFDSIMSNTRKQEKEWFSKAEYTENDISRFGYMPFGTRKDYWEFKVDLEELEVSDTIFLIDFEKYVNRPDAISHKVYGNAKYWWIIAMRNGITDPFIEFYKGRKLKIPDLKEVKQKLGFG